MSKLKTPVHLNDLKSTIGNLKDSFENISIYCHPDNLRFLKEISQEIYPEKQYNRKYNYYNSFGDWSPPIYGIEIYTDSSLEKCAKHWEFPSPPAHWTGDFWEYKKEDEAWAIPIGHGRWVYDETSPVFYIIKKNSYIYNSYYLDKFMYSFPIIDTIDTKKLMISCI